MALPDTDLTGMSIEQLDELAELEHDANPAVEFVTDFEFDLDAEHGSNTEQEMSG